MHSPATALRPVLVVGLTGGLLLSPLAVGSADAHVRVSADTSVAGAYSALTFRVPNESEEASTTVVSVELPQDTPFTSVRSRPLPGWTAEVVKAPLPTPVEVDGATLTEAARTVTWTADADAAIGPDQYQEFALAVGPLPDPGTLLLPATQTYSDGEVVRWDQAVPATGEEPEHPSPVVEVVEAAVVPGHDGAARWLGGAALAVAVLAAGAAGFLLRSVRPGRRR